MTVNIYRRKKLRSYGSLMAAASSRTPKFSEPRLLRVALLSYWIQYLKDFRVQRDWAFELLDPMDDSSSGSSCSDIEQSVSESSSHQSLSIGYFPSEENVDSEAITPGEDVTSEDPSLPPDQGPWGTQSVRGPMGRRNEIQEKPEELGKEDIDEVVNAYLHSLQEDSAPNLAQSDDDQRMDKYQKETTTQTVWELDDFSKTIMEWLDNLNYDEDDDPVLSYSLQEEDIQLSISVSSQMLQVSPEEEEEACIPQENGDIKQFLKMPPELEEDEIVEMESQEPGTAKSSPGSSEQSEEGDLPSDKERTSCMNFQGFFHWLRKRFVSSLPGRKHRREKAKKVSCCWR
ncbi:uncharacterized protein C12orf71 homolog [Callospermophilus lateralis]|uniref:uncharacterized protein C12orf71 homolog n=1 Tax=Callospermophilus lateralis TaxID=76772 RepID=UPI004053C475